MLSVAIFGLAVVIVTISSSVLKACWLIPRAELKRLAQKGQTSAAALYSIIAYGKSGTAFLWLILNLGTAYTLYFITVWTNGLAAFSLMALTLCLLFLWVSSGRQLSVAQSVAVRTSPLLTKILGALYPITRQVGRLSSNTQPKHTQLYQIDDLLELIDRQYGQPDSRISTIELEIIKRSADLASKLVRDYIRPLKSSKIVSPDDHIGPVLLDELHQSGQQQFLVGDHERIVGTLMLEQAASVTFGTVKDRMSEALEQIGQSATLLDALTVCKDTKQNLLLVVDKKGRAVGTITLDTILAELLPSQNEQEHIEAVAD